MVVAAMPVTEQKIFLSPPHMSGLERYYVAEAFDTNWIAPLGPHVDAFEREFCELTGAGYAAALTSGTAALHLAMILLGVGPGDEVLGSTFTFSASVNPIAYCGARPTFIDSERTSWNMDPESGARDAGEARALAGKLPKAVIAVDLYGQAADLDAIKDACDEYGVPLVEDAAAAVGTTYKGRAAGTVGKFGAFSFNGNKIITTSGGGMLVSDDRAAIEHARKLATQARDPALHYEHTRDRLQLSPQERPRGDRARPVAGGRGSRRRPAPQLRLLRARPRRSARLTFQPEAPWGRHTRWLTNILIDPARVRRGSRNRAAGAGGGEHRVAPVVEADAHAAGLRGVRPYRRGRRGGTVRDGPLAPLRLDADRGRDGARRRRHPPMRRRGLAAGRGRCAMGLMEYGKIIRRWWWLPVLGCLLFAVAGYARERAAAAHVPGVGTPACQSGPGPRPVQLQRSPDERETGDDVHATVAEPVAARSDDQASRPADRRGDAEEAHQRQCRPRHATDRRDRLGLRAGARRRHRERAGDALRQARAGFADEQHAGRPPADRPRSRYGAGPDHRHVGPPQSTADEHRRDERDDAGDPAPPATARAVRSGPAGHPQPERGRLQPPQSTEDDPGPDGRRRSRKSSVCRIS